MKVKFSKPKHFPAFDLTNPTKILNHSYHIEQIITELLNTQGIMATLCECINGVIALQLIYTLVFLHGLYTKVRHNVNADIKVYTMQ